MTNLESVVGSVNQATDTMEFEDGLRVSFPEAQC